MTNRDLIQYRKATETDAESITRLVNSAYRGSSSKNGWTTEADLLAGQRTDPSMILETLHKPKTCFLLAEKQGQVIGSVQLEKISPETCYFGMFAIDPCLQAQGTGRGMVAEAEKFAKWELGCEFMEMTVITVRHELIAWYERLGYEKTGETRPFPYGDERFGIPLRDDLALGVWRKRLLI